MENGLKCPNPSLLTNITYSFNHYYPMELAKSNQLNAASFDSMKRGWLAVDMIINLLKTAIKEERKVTIDDIVNAYADYRIKRNLGLLAWVRSGTGTHGRFLNKAKMEKEKWVESIYNKRDARTWFMKGLGAAIIEGKILAVPIIDI